MSRPELAVERRTNGIELRIKGIDKGNGYVH